MRENTLRPGTEAAAAGGGGRRGRAGPGHVRSGRE